jgi:hypothetical protein
METFVRRPSGAQRAAPAKKSPTGTQEHEEQCRGGLTLLHGFLLISIANPILLFFANPLPMKLVELSVPLQWLLNVFYRSLVAPPSMTYAVPALVWLLMLWVVPSMPPPTLSAKAGAAAAG